MTHSWWNGGGLPARFGIGVGLIMISGVVRVILLIVVYLRRTFCPGNLPDFAAFGPRRRTSLAVRITAIWRAHPAHVLVVSVMVVAAAAAAATPIATPDADKSEPNLGNTIVWRDGTGAYRARVDGGRFEQFRRQRRQALAAARTASRDQAAEEIPAVLKPVFADIRARVPRYADWYFSYTTKYELMGHALVPVFDYLGANFTPSRRQDGSLVREIGAHMARYLKEQYAERVVRPRGPEIRLQAAFDNSYDALLSRWRRLAAVQHEALGAFIAREGSLVERLSAEQAAGLKLDWDAVRDETATGHKNVATEQRFQRGLLLVKMITPQSAGAPAHPDIGENTAEDSDEIRHVIVNLFDRLVGPAISEMGNLAIGVVAAGGTSGTTVGLGTIAGPPATIATGVAVAVPIGAAIGLAAMVGAEMLSNRLEESLSRAELEENLRQTVDATETAMESRMISVLHAHVEAWYSDIVDPITVR